MRAFQAGRLRVQVYDDRAELDHAAASRFAVAIASELAQSNEATAVMATGNSQLGFLAKLRCRRDIAWSRISVLHMDEYLGMSPDHPASFRRYMREHLTDIVRPKAFHGIRADAANLQQELTRYTALLQQMRPAVCVMGVGENGHLAFNDPPADFHTPEWLKVVTLDDACRRQQVGEGHFASIEEIPKRAVTMTVSALLRAHEIIVIAPERRKASAVQAALEGPVTRDCPASVLRRAPNAVLLLDEDSASLLQRTG